MLEALLGGSVKALPQTESRQPAPRVGEGFCSGMEVLTGLLDIPSSSL